MLIITSKSHIEDIVIIMKLRRSKVSYFLEFSAKLTSLGDEIAIYLDYELTIIGELGVDLGHVLVPEGDVNLRVHGQALLQGLGQDRVVSGVRLGAFLLHKLLLVIMKNRVRF